MLRKQSISAGRDVQRVASATDSRINEHATQIDRRMKLAAGPATKEKERKRLVPGICHLLACLALQQQRQSSRCPSEAAKCSAVHVLEAKVINTGKSCAQGASKTIWQQRGVCRTCFFPLHVYPHRSAAASDKLLFNFLEQPNAEALFVAPNAPRLQICVVLQQQAAKFEVALARGQIQRRESSARSSEFDSMQSKFRLVVQMRA